MRNSIFGWSYPPGCNGPPDDYDYEYKQPQCSHCGAFLKTKADMIAPATFIEVDYSFKPVGVDHKYVEYCKEVKAGEEAYGIPEYEVGYIRNDYCAIRKCRKCGHLNEEYDY